MVTDVTGLNLQGRDAIKVLGINIDEFFFPELKLFHQPLLIGILGAKPDIRAQI